MHGSFGRSRWARSVAVGTVVACAALAASASGAWAGASRASYTVKISPSTAPAGQSTMFDVALTNTSSAGIQLGSAALTPPLGFRVTGASLPAGASGHAYMILNIVVLDRLSVAPGATLHVSVTATAPSRCKSPFDLWLSVANAGGLFGQLLRLDVGNSSLTTPVTCDTGTALEFTGQPNNALTATDITGSSYSTSGPPLKVEIVDSSGNTVNSSEPVTVALVNPQGGTGTLSGTATEKAVDGVATFSDLTVNNSDNGYTLAASSPGLTSGNSTQFDVSSGETDCTTTANCMLTVTGPESTLGIVTGPNGGQLNAQVDPGMPLDGPSSNSDADPGCAGYTPQNLDWYGFDVSTVPGTTAGSPAKTLTWTVKNASPEGFMACFGSSSPFDSVNANGGVGSAPAGTLSDGTPGFVGFLPFCDTFDSNVSEPCITDDPLNTQEDPNSNTGVDVIVEVSIPAGFPGDPFLGRG